MHSPDLAPFSSLAADDGTHATAYQALVDRSAGCSTHDDRMFRADVAYGKFWMADIPMRRQDSGDQGRPRLS